MTSNVWVALSSTVTIVVSDLLVFVGLGDQTILGANRQHMLQLSNIDSNVKNQRIYFYIDGYNVYALPNRLNKAMGR